MSKFPAYVVLPADLVDRHLASASGVYVKVLLAVLRRQTVDPAPIAAWLSLPESDVREAVGYWISCGVLEQQDVPAGQTAAPERKPAPKKTRLTAEEVGEHVAASSELQFILATSEGIYGRPLTDTERRGLVYFYEELALPADVIVMAVDFCISNGRKQFNYLQKLCVGWSEQGVTTHALAEEYILKQNQRISGEKAVMEAFGIRNRGLTTEEKQFVSRWLLSMGFTLEMIRLAYDRAVDKIGRLSFPYINKILENWQEKGIRAPEDIDELDQPPVQSAAPRKNTPGSAPRTTSYDGEAFDALGLELPPDAADLFG
ncbi:MAG: DnaD domain protein [Oscillospiraceae bacterium]|nr:DnaD domain protein [Oscillospiraceae bacterium]